jgi:flagellar motor switch protein FliM
MLDKLGSDGLSQSEIDALLGKLGASSTSYQAPATPTQGVQAIVMSRRISYERLPMLEVVFDRWVRLLSTALRNFTSDAIDVSLEPITTMRFADYLAGLSNYSLTAVARAQEWENSVLMNLEPNLIYSMVDVLLGGRKTLAPMPLEGRTYTSIERSLIERLLTLSINELSTAFAPLTSVHFALDRLETSSKFAMVCRPSNAVIVARLRIEMENRGGIMELVVPYATLEPIRDVLLQMFLGEKFGQDSIWENHLAQELWKTQLELKAIFDEQTMTLEDVMNLKVGSQVMLSAHPDEPIEIRCEDVTLFTGRVGRKGEKVAIQIDQKIESKKERLPTT